VVPSGAEGLAREVEVMLLRNQLAVFQAANRQLETALGTGALSRRVTKAGTCEYCGTKVGGRARCESCGAPVKT